MPLEGWSWLTNLQKTTFPLVLELQQPAEQDPGLEEEGKLLGLESLLLQLLLPLLSAAVALVSSCLVRFWSLVDHRQQPGFHHFFSVL